MQSYNVELTFLGKKFKVNIEASSKKEAIGKIKENVKIANIEKQPKNLSSNIDVYNQLKNILGIK